MTPLPPWFDLGYREAIVFYAQMIEAAGSNPEELRKTKRHLAGQDLFFLLCFVLRRPDAAHPWIYARCREFQRAPDGHLDLWARYHYKSTVITFAGTIFDIIQNPETTIGIFSHTKGAAKKFLVQIKQELESNKELVALWPEIFWDRPASQAEKWSEADGITVKRQGNPKEATVEAHGLVDGLPTGRHFQQLLYDDIVTAESVSTPYQIEKTTDAFRQSTNLGTLEGARFRFAGTRYHLFDTYRTIIEDEIAKPRVHPCTKNGLEGGEPVLMTRGAMELARKNQGPYIFSSQMLLNPVADKAMGFRECWVDFSDTDYQAAMSSLWRFILVDPAGGKQRKNNDYTTFFVIGYGLDNKFRVLDIRRDRMSLSGRANTLFELHVQWRPGLVAYEEYGMQADIEHIKHLQKEKLYEFDITPLGGNMRKELRILRLVPYFENGYRDDDPNPKSRIVLPTSLNRIDHNGQNRDLVRDFMEQEYTAFPVLAHDDMLDCLSRIVDIEAMGLLQTPSVTPPSMSNNRLASALRKKNQGSGSWITA